MMQNLVPGEVEDIMREVPDPEEFEEAAANPAAEGDDRAWPGLPDDQ